jgi:hypothetical protein
MAAKYRKIDPRIWNDEGFRELSAEEQRIALYCLTSQQCNRVGLFVFSPAHASEDLGTLPPTFAERFGNVCQTLHWRFDPGARVLYMPTWWKYNRPDNPNQFQACLEDLHDLPATPLLTEFYANSQFLTNEMAKRLANVAPNVPGNVTPNHPPQEQEQEQEQEHTSPSPPPGAGGGGGLGLAGEIAEAVAAELRFWKVHHKSIAEIVAKHPDLRPVHVALLGLRGKAGEAKRGVPNFLVDSLRDDEGYEPPMMVSPEAVERLHRAGRLREVCGHAVNGDLHTSGNGVWAGTGEPPDGWKVHASELLAGEIEIGGAA